MSNQTFPNELPESIASKYDPALLHDEIAAQLTPEQRHQAQLAAEAVISELQQSLRLHSM